MRLSRYHGGRTPEEVARLASALKEDGLLSAIALLPRFRLTHAGVEAETERILALLPALEKGGVGADLTVKLSQLGLRWDRKDCLGHLVRIAREAARKDAFIWIDMEQSSQVDATLSVFREAAKEAKNIGVCLQTCLQRTPRDLEVLLREGHPVRLVKGYYREWPPAAFPTWRETTECYRSLIGPLLEKSRKPAVGTHDPTLLDHAIRNAGDRKFEIQMFLGARMDLARRLAAEGHTVRIYIPYGALAPYILHSLPFMDLSRNIQRALGFETIR